MIINAVVENNVLNIHFNGELDECSASYTRNYLDNAIKSNMYDSVVFDMSGLEFMDSTGIGVLLGRYKILKSKEKNMFIYNPTPVVEKIINMSGIYEIMPKIS
jgi:stage II sporulation protein AA (anti-sigma F factor antagonist)